MSQKQLNRHVAIERSLEGLFAAYAEYINSGRKE